MLALLLGLGFLGVLASASRKPTTAPVSRAPSAPPPTPQPRIQTAQDGRLQAARKVVAQQGAEHTSTRSKALMAVQRVRRGEVPPVSRPAPTPPPRPAHTPTQARPAVNRAAPLLRRRVVQRPASVPQPVARKAPPPAPPPAPARRAAPPAPPMRTAPITSMPAARETPLAERVARDIYAKGRGYDHKLLQEFQRQARLQPDGLYGQKSHDALLKAGIKKPPPVIFGTKKR